MVDRRRIVRQWRQGDASVLITLVRALGSSYRRPGAHLLVGRDGSSCGTISGGCLESEVVRKAAWKVRDGAVVERYSTMFDDAAEMPYGLGCGGVVDLLFEPVDTPECSALLAAMEASLGGEETLALTWLPGDQLRLRRAIVSSGRDISFASDGLSVSTVAAACAKTPATAAGVEEHGPAFERILPAQRLFIMGAGDDAKPLVSMAAQLGWNITVLDGRAQMAQRERFPDADRVVTAASAEGFDFRPEDAVVLMTHSYEQDFALLGDILRTRSGVAGAAAPGYIGLLGAKHRSILLVSEVAASVGCGIAECCERIHAPVGLDLGGDGPEAIALAVISEVQAWTQGKIARSRRLTVDDVAEYVAQADGTRFLHAHCAMPAAELPHG